MFWWPQAQLMVCQSCRRFFSSRCGKQHVCCCKKVTCLENIYFRSCLIIMFTSGKTNRRGMQFHVEKSSNFVLNSHLDPVGDQNDVHYLAIYCVYLAYLVLYLPTVQQKAIGNSNRQDIVPPGSPWFSRFHWFLFVSSPHSVSGEALMVRECILRY